MKVSKYSWLEWCTLPASQSAFHSLTYSYWILRIRYTLSTFKSKIPLLTFFSYGVHIPTLPRINVSFAFGVQILTIACLNIKPFKHISNSQIHPAIYGIPIFTSINPLNPELNPICYFLALLAHHFLHVSGIRVKSLTLWLLMSYIYIYIYIYGAPILDVSRSHTTTHHSR